MLKLSTINELRDSGLLTFSEYEKTDENDNTKTYTDSSDNKLYKIDQTEAEIKIELLYTCTKLLSSIKTTLIVLTFFIICFIFLLFF